MENKEVVTTESEFQECRDTPVNGFNCKCKAMANCAFYKPTTEVEELDAVNDSTTLLIEEIAEESTLSYKGALDKLFQLQDMIITDHAQNKQSKVVEVIEGLRSDRASSEYADGYNQALTDLLTKLKQ